jgi:MSHA biogenesis protein MshQ
MNTRAPLHFTNRRIWTCAFGLLLLVLVTGNARAAQSQWWDTNYAYRQQIDVASGTAALVAGYSISYSFNHTAEVTAGRSLATGNDVRVVYWNGTTWKELDRVIDVQSNWNTTTTQIWFATVGAVAANTDDNQYFIYYGNPSPATPLQDPEKIFLLYDAFSGTSLDTTRWTATGTPAVAGGMATLQAGEKIRSNSAFGTDTIWEASVQVSAALPASGAPAYYLWLATNDSNLTGRDAGFYEDRTDTRAVSQTATGAANITTKNLGEPAPTSWRLYSFSREGTARLRYWIDGTLEATITSDIATGSLSAFAWNSAIQVREQRYDWVRVRYYSTGNPSSSAYGDREQNVAVGQWRMEQTSWNGTANEALDTSGSNLHLSSIQSGGSGAVTAIASPAKPGSPGTCRYGVFDGSNDYLQRADNAVLDLKSRLTITAWIYTRSTPAELKSIVSKDDNYEFHLNTSRQVYWWWGGAPKELTSSTAVPLNQWTHVAITYESGEQHIYINGVSRASGTQTGTLPQNALPFQIGQDQGLAGRFWDGYIDEVQIYNRPLSQSEVAAVMNATYACPGAAPPHFVIAHSNYAIACVGSIVKVYARDAANNPNSAYASTVELDTQTGQGTWTLNQGSGAFTSLGNGQATYQWPLGATEAWFTLQYPNGGVISDIDAYQVSDTSIRDDDTEGALAFTPSGFTLTSTALSNPPPGTIPSFAISQIAGTNVPLYLAAYGQTANDPTCGIIEGYAGTKTLSFWTLYNNPSTGAKTVTVDGIASSSAEPANGAATQTVAFTNGQAQVAIKYKDVGSISIGVKDGTSNPLLPTGIRGATSQIVFKPKDFALSTITKTGSSPVLNNPQASSATGAVFLKAGEPFTATISALDAEGSVTPNFGRENSPESVRLATVLVLPATGGTNPDVTTPTALTFTGGTVTRTDLYWSEVGIMQIQPRLKSGNYLALAGDVIGSPSVNVGRFIPDHFNVTPANAPAFQTACSAGGFSYIGQPLSYTTPPILTVTALSLQSSTTLNYKGSLFKITNGSLTGKQYLEQTTNSVLNLSGLPSVDPTITDNNNGTGTLVFSANGLALTRSTPVAPFLAKIKLSINVLDTDSVAYPTNPYAIGTTTGIAFSGSNEQRYGRIAFRNAVGSELINLPLPMRAEYYLNDTNGFVVNAQDSCTTAVPIAVKSVVGNLATNQTCPLVGGVCSTSSGAVSAGAFNISMKAPGAGNGGTATVEATPNNWLKFNWDSSTPADENPTGIATFGIYQGESSRIYQHESY